MSTLRYPPFRNDLQLLAAHKNNPALHFGMSGSGVALIQGALLELKKYPLPVSTRKTGAPDGVYGSETTGMVIKYQRDRGLEDNGWLGRYTLEALDLDMVSIANTDPLPPVPYPRPIRSPRVAEYKLGTDDPATSHDAGAGPWSSKPVQLAYVALKQQILEKLGAAQVIIGYDAATHMRHYLKGSGNDFEIDLEGMIGEVPSARTRYEAEIWQFKHFAETLSPGTHDITSTTVETGRNLQEEGLNWFLAVGDYVTWAKGRVLVTERDGKKWFKADIEYKFYDRYNWDHGKVVRIFDIVIEDDLLGELHLQGLAREFDMRGSFTRTLEWPEGDPWNLKPFVRV
ncbi:MAG TPA: peptidoglycan-binding domain-containing protein [Polyangiales bacterium]|nr:peptidoglycan-binding domain-containing protein [Polyangiales bacterium]